MRPSWVFRFFILAFVAVVPVGGGCGKTVSVLSTDSAVNSDASANNGDADTDVCPFVGTWLLVSYYCGTIDVTQSWLSVVSSTTFEFTRTAGGCHSVLTNRSSSCTETESFELVVGKNSFEQTANGIQSCSPEGCTFSASDAPCVTGDRAAETNTTTYTFTATTLTMTTVPTTDSICGAGIEEILTLHRQ